MRIECDFIRTSSPEKHVARVGPMYRCVAHGACLVFGGLVVVGPGGPLRREGMTLQAQQVHLAHPQEARVGRTVGGVTTATAFRLDRYMLKNEGSLFVRMATGTNRIPCRHSPHLANGGRAMDVVAVAALDETFVYSMVIRLREVSLGGNMTSVAEIGLCLNEEVLRFFGVVRRVAVQAANIVARMRRCGEVALLVLFAVTTQAAGAGVLP